jgi:hypothetical protein
VDDKRERLDVFTKVTIVVPEGTKARSDLARLEKLIRHVFEHGLPPHFAIYHAEDLCVYFSMKDLLDDHLMDALASD